MGGLSIWHWLIVLLVVRADLRHQEAAQHRPGPGRRGEGLQGRHEERRGGRRRRPKDAAAPAREDRRQDDRRRGQEGADPADVERRVPGARVGACAPAALDAPAMFDIGFTEIVVIAVVALIVIGPERLPKAARTLGPSVRPPAALRRTTSSRTSTARWSSTSCSKLQAEVQTAATDFESSVSADGERSRGRASATSSASLNAAAAAERATDRRVAERRRADGAGVAAAAAEPARRSCARSAAPAPRPPRQPSLPGFERG